MNDKIKAQWMAQYLGQHVVEASFLNETFTLSGMTLSELNINSKEFITINKNSLILSGDFSGVGYEGTSQADISECHLLLRTVDMLTDEECYQIDILLNPKSQIETKSNKTIFDLHVKIVRDILTDGFFTFHRSIWDLQPVLNYLIGIGILLPFTCLNEKNQPITFSPDEIIALGWAKIVTA